MATPKFPVGTPVLINNNIAAVVFYRYNMYVPTAKPYFLYRVIVDANELCHRVRNNNTDQTAPKDAHLFNEDFERLFTETETVAVIEVGEEQLTAFEDARSFYSDNQ